MVLLASGTHPKRPSVRGHHQQIWLDDAGDEQLRNALKVARVGLTDLDRIAVREIKRFYLFDLSETLHYLLPAPIVYSYRMQSDMKRVSII